MAFCRCCLLRCCAAAAAAACSSSSSGSPEGATVTTWRKPSLKQLITGDSHFIYYAAGTPSAVGSEAAVALDVAQLRTSLQSKAGHEGATELHQLLSLAQYQSSKGKGSAAQEDPNSTGAAGASSSRQQAEQQAEQQVEQQRAYEEEAPVVINEAVLKLEELEQQAGTARVQVVSKPGPQLEAAVAQLRSCAQVALALELSGGGEVMLVQVGEEWRWCGACRWRLWAMAWCGAMWCDGHELTLGPPWGTEAASYNGTCVSKPHRSDRGLTPLTACSACALWLMGLV